MYCLGPSNLNNNVPIRKEENWEYAKPKISPLSLDWLLKEGRDGGKEKDEEANNEG
jgi:hypothetical protein